MDDGAAEHIHDGSRTVGEVGAFNELAQRQKNVFRQRAVLSTGGDAIGNREFPPEPSRKLPAVNVGELESRATFTDSVKEVRRPPGESCLQHRVEADDD